MEEYKSKEDLNNLLEKVKKQLKKQFPLASKDIHCQWKENSLQVNRGYQISVNFNVNYTIHLEIFLTTVGCTIIEYESQFITSVLFNNFRKEQEIISEITNKLRDLSSKIKQKNE